MSLTSTAISYGSGEVTPAAIAEAFDTARTQGAVALLISDMPNPSTVPGAVRLWNITGVSGDSFDQIACYYRSISSMLSNAMQYRVFDVSKELQPQLEAEVASRQVGLDLSAFAQPSDRPRGIER